MRTTQFFAISILTMCLLYQSLCDDSESSDAMEWEPEEWPTENMPHETETQDIRTKCICRYRNYDSVTCFSEKNCVTFPKIVFLHSTTIELHIQDTAINTLKKGDLEHMQQLKSLNIFSNSQLKTIEPYIFLSMDNLINLSISRNPALTWLHNDTFVGLTNLVNLRLEKNGFRLILSVTQSLQLKYIPNVQTVSLNENLFGIIEEGSFSALNGASLKELNLVLCKVQNISSKALNEFRALEALRLGENHLSIQIVQELLVELINKQIPISTLNLRNFGAFQTGEDFKNLLKTINLLNVNHLVLSGNHFEEIYAGLFPEMPSITILDIRDVTALNVQKNAFNNTLFPNLKILLLGKNRLYEIPSNLTLNNLKVLDMSGKALKPFDFRISANSFKGIKRLASLDLSNNNLHKIINDSLIGLRKLKSLRLRNAIISYIAPNAFAELENLLVLHLSKNPLVQHDKFDQIFNGLKSLEFLHLCNCNLVHIKSPKLFNSLPKLRYLYLQANGFTTLDGKLLDPLNMLIGLDVSNNFLQPWEGTRLPYNKTMKILLMGNNRINYISPTMMEDFQGLSRIDLSENIFTCDCFYFVRTIEFFHLKNISIDNSTLDSPYYMCKSEGEENETSLAVFLKNVSCSEVHMEYYFAAAIFILSLIIAVIMYIYRPYVRYYIFIAKITIIRYSAWLRRNNRVQPSGNYKYDVFVSYSNEDRNFIVRLVSVLENQPPYLKLCIYERDFEIGSVLSDTIMEKVTASRRVLLVVSNSFAKSHWCMWEMRLAEYRRIFHIDSNAKSQPLVILKLGKIEESNLTPTLKFLLKTRIHLEWHDNPQKQALLWEKLRNALVPSDTTR